MRAEEKWFFAATIWLAAIWLSVDGPLWIAAGAAALCLGLSAHIRLQRRKDVREGRAR